MTLFYLVPNLLLLRRQQGAAAAGAAVGSDEWFASGTRQVAPRVQVYAKFIKMVAFSLLVLYPRCSSASLRLFVCQRVEGVDYLVSDFSLHCYDDMWWKITGINILMIVVYPCDVVLLLTVCLARAHSTLRCTQDWHPGVAAVRAVPVRL